MKKRSIACILNVLTSKLRRLISDITDNEHSPEGIDQALCNPETEKVLKRRISLGCVQLVDSISKSPLFTRQMSQIGEHGYRAADKSPDASEIDKSESQVEPDAAELKVNPDAMDEIVNTVKYMIRRQSTA